MMERENKRKRGQISVHQGRSLGSLCGEMMPLAGNLPKRVLCLAYTPSKPAGTAQSGVSERTGIFAREIPRAGFGQPVSHVEG